VVYPTAFWVERKEQDESGIVHNKKSLLAGESWSRGPVILSWQDIERDMQHDDQGHNVIIHEFAHKIDMLNQGANGVPPFPVGVSAKNWGQVFRNAYHKLANRIRRHHKTCIDPYGGTSPAEYFAVASESFFTEPQHLNQCNHKVYNELKMFYQQDPLQRLL
ncbi:MAG: zinc-dependent peptidase, partial [Gammaproteobacteria bacterium]|nr:zinc-dependent peptidase [Gammaproteobacteria bacterium]